MIEANKITSGFDWSVVGYVDSPHPPLVISNESYSTNIHRFKAILVIDKNKNVYEWTHDK